MNRISPDISPRVGPQPYPCMGRCVGGPLAQVQGVGLWKLAEDWLLLAAAERGLCCLFVGSSPTELLQSFDRRFKMKLSDRFQLPPSEFPGELGDQEREQREFVWVAESSEPMETPVLELFSLARRGLDRFFRSQFDSDFFDSCPLQLKGTPFQVKVWLELTQIPFGTTVTYGTIAQRLGFPRGVRAVAAACGANPLAVVVPCHRVVGKNGNLTGYRWGLELKQRLLQQEQRILNQGR